MDCNLQAAGGQAGDVSVWCPLGLDVDRLLKMHGPRIGEGVLLLGHFVYLGLADDARCREEGAVPLKAEYLHKIIGRHHLDAVRRAAVEAGYMYWDRSYQAGVRSQSYRLLPPYDDARLARRQIRDAALRHNVQKWREARRRETRQRVQRGEVPVNAAVCDHLWWNLQRVRIDAEIDFDKALHSAKKTDAEQMRYRELLLKIAAEGIRGGEWRFKVDDHGRIHTNLTNTPRTLRQYLSVDSQRLANVDIGESQPLFVGLALAQVSNERAIGTKKAAARGEGKQEEEAKGGRGSSPLMIDNTMFDKLPQLEGGFARNRLSADLRRYLGLCESRGLYQTVADRLGGTRDEAKKRVMVVFYDKPQHRNKVAAVLDELFPTVMRDIRRLKQGDYRRLAHFAQRIESAFMFGRVVPRLMRLRPDLFVATIHDSVLTTAGDGEFVRRVMLDEFARLGLKPTVNVERLG